MPTPGHGSAADHPHTLGGNSPPLTGRGAGRREGIHLRPSRPFTQLRLDEHGMATPRFGQPLRNRPQITHEKPRRRGRSGSSGLRHGEGSVPERARGRAPTAGSPPPPPRGPPRPPAAPGRCHPPRQRRAGNKERRGLAGPAAPGLMVPYPPPLPTPPSFPSQPARAASEPAARDVPLRPAAAPPYLVPLSADDAVHIGSLQAEGEADADTQPQPAGKRERRAQGERSEAARRGAAEGGGRRRERTGAGPQRRRIRCWSKRSPHRLRGRGTAPRNPPPLTGRAGGGAEKSGIAPPRNKSGRAPPSASEGGRGKVTGSGCCGGGSAAWGSGGWGRRRRYRPWGGKTSRVWKGSGRDPQAREKPGLAHVFASHCHRSVTRSSRQRALLLQSFHFFKPGVAFSPQRWLPLMGQMCTSRCRICMQRQAPTLPQNTTYNAGNCPWEPVPYTQEARLRSAQLLAPAPLNRSGKGIFLSEWEISTHTPPTHIFRNKSYLARQSSFKTSLLINERCLKSCLFVTCLHAR